MQQSTIAMGSLQRYPHPLRLGMRVMEKKLQFYGEQFDALEVKTEFYSHSVIFMLATQEVLHLKLTD